MDYLSKGEVLTNTDLDRFVNNIWENRPFVYIEKVLDLWVQLMKNRGKNNSVAFIILVSVNTILIYKEHYNALYGIQGLFRVFRD